MQYCTQSYRTLIQNSHYIPEDAIKIALPQVRQLTDYSCGAAAFRAICRYFRVGPKKEKQYINLLNTTYKCGPCQ